MAFEIRSPLHQMCGGVDLRALLGLGAMHALELISEIGLDLSRWPSERHFTSWLGLALHNRISGGKVLSSGTPRTSSRAAHDRQHRDRSLRALALGAKGLGLDLADPFTGAMVGRSVS